MMNHQIRFSNISILGHDNAASGRKRSTALAKKGQMGFEQMDDRVMMSASPWTSDVSIDRSGPEPAAIMGDVSGVNEAVESPGTIVTASSSSGADGKPADDDDSDWGPLAPYVHEVVDVSANRFEAEPAVNAGVADGDLAEINDIVNSPGSFVSASSSSGADGKPAEDDDSDWGPLAPYVIDFVESYVNKLTERVSHYRRYFARAEQIEAQVSRGLSQLHTDLGRLVKGIAQMESRTSIVGGNESLEPEPQPWSRADFMADAMTRVRDAVGNRFDGNDRYYHADDHKGIDFKEFIKKLGEFANQTYLGVEGDRHPDWTNGVLDFADDIVSQFMDMPEVMGPVSAALGIDLMPAPDDDDDLGPIGPVAMRAVMYQSLFELFTESGRDPEPWKPILFDRISEDATHTSEPDRTLKPGDANRDCEFNSSDLIQVLAAGRYETGRRATFAEGDWNGDGVFDSSDFIEALSTGLYETGPYC